MGRPTLGKEKLQTVATALTTDEITKVDKSESVGTRSAKIRALILKALGE